MSFIKKSPWIFFYDSGDCNGCILEILAATDPRYDIERLGALVKTSPRHADILLVTGIVNKQQKKRLVRVYSQMAEPKIVVAMGVCPISGGVFWNSKNKAGPLDKIIPVDVYIPGCPPRPETLIDGLLKAINAWEAKQCSKKKSKK